MQPDTVLDPGFINERLCGNVLPRNIFEQDRKQAKDGGDHMTVLHNYRLLRDALLKACDESKTPTLQEALAHRCLPCLFRSLIRLAPCPEVYDKPRVDYAIDAGLCLSKPVRIAYHTMHIISDTGRWSLSKGCSDGHIHAIIGMLHDRPDRFEIQPLMIGILVPSFLADDGVVLARSPLRANGRSKQPAPTPREAKKAAKADRNQKWCEEAKQYAGKEPRTQTAARIAKREGEKDATVYRTLSRGQNKSGQMT